MKSTTITQKKSGQHQKVHFARFVQKLAKIGNIAVLSLGIVSNPLFASEIDRPLLPSDNSTPTVAANNVLQTPSSVTQPQSQSNPESSTDFFLAGPLSSANSTPSQSGRALYVSTKGSNDSDGSKNMPWQSLSYAISQLKAGDTLNIEAGTYNVTAGASFTTSGTSDAHITIQGVGNVVIDGKDLYAYTPVFNTAGQSFLDFKNLTVNNSRAAVQVNSNSSNILVDGLNTNHNQFAVDIEQGSYVTVRNSVAVDSRNAFMATGTSNHLTFENVTAYGSQDIYSGSDAVYRNGDGFIMNLGTNYVTFKNIVSHDNWDAGIDCKANNVVIDGAIVYSNKNNFKMWGENIVIQNSLSYGARYLSDDPVSGEGNGLNVRTGSVTVINSTFFDNATNDIQVDNQGGASNVSVQNSIFYRNISSGTMIALVGGNFTEKNNLWYWAGHTNPGFTISSTSKWEDPQFVNASSNSLPPLTNTAANTRKSELTQWGVDLHLQSASPAIDFGNSSLVQSSTDLNGNARIRSTSVDVGAYEYQGNAPEISAVTASDITLSGALISWATDKTSDSQVQYRVQGTTAWSVTSVDSSMVKNHSVLLKGLNANAIYEFQVKSKDNAGNLYVQATISNFKTTPSTDNCTTPMCGITNGQTVSGVVNIQPNATLISEIKKVAYYLNGDASGKEYTAPFTWGGANGFDTTKLADGEYTLNGAYTTRAGDQIFIIKFTVKNTEPVTPPAPSVCTTAMCGVANGETVSGVVKIQPNATLNPDIRKVAYYLNGTGSGKEYTFPFTWGGVDGFDTTKLANGTYTLNGAYTTNTGDKIFTITFTVKNNVTPPAVCKTAICGISNGDVLSGVVKIQPNLTLNPSIKKVAYYLNGISSREYESPFTWGGIAGYDTRKLANGTYTISGAYTTSDGDVTFSFTVTVKN